MHRFGRKQDWHVDIESSEMRDEIDLSFYLDPGDENLDSVELGKRIDDALVESIYAYTLSLRRGSTSPHEYQLSMDRIEEGMKADREYRDFAMTLHKRDLRPASATYLDLVSQHFLHGEKRCPSNKQGRDFALVMLDHLSEPASWEADWDRETVVEILADAWLDSRDPIELEKLIVNSYVSWLAWDILYLNSREVRITLVDLPKEHHVWYVEATDGQLKRPEERPVPKRRPLKLGYILRNNEIRHTVHLLALVGMEEIDGCYAVAYALSLSRPTVRRIYRQPLSEIRDLAEHAIERLDPKFCLTPFQFWLRIGPRFNSVARKLSPPDNTRDPKR